MRAKAHVDLARRLGHKDLYNCAFCAQHPALYEQLGHDGPPTNYWREHLLTGEPLARCPMRDLLDARETDPPAHAEVEHYLAVYFPAYRDGHLLVAGGIGDQPARYVEMTRLLTDLAAEIEEKYYAIQAANKEPA